MEDDSIAKETKQELTSVYQSLNPVELKRAIDKKLDNFHKAYQKKNNSQKVNVNKKQIPRSVRFLVTQPDPVSVR